jgi:hypothetical protein
MRAPLLLAFKDKMASSHTIVQSIVDDQKRGPVLSLFVMARRGIESLGSLVFGASGAWVGNARHSMPSAVAAFAPRFRRCGKLELLW